MKKLLCVVLFAVGCGGEAAEVGHKGGYASVDAGVLPAAASNEPSTTDDGTSGHLGRNPGSGGGTNQ